MIRSSSTGGNFFAAVKSFDANIAKSGNFVLTVKNSSDMVDLVTNKIHKHGVH